MAFGGSQKATVACGNQNPMNVDSFSFPHGTVGFLEPPGGLWRVPKGHRSMRKPKIEEDCENHQSGAYGAIFVPDLR